MKNSTQNVEEQKNVHRFILVEGTVKAKKKPTSDVAHYI